MNPYGLHRRIRGSRDPPQYHFPLLEIKVPRLGGHDFKGEVPGYLCVLNKGPGTEVAMLAEWIKHNEMVLIKTLTDHLLQSPEGTGLTQSSGGTMSLESL